MTTGHSGNTLGIIIQGTRHDLRVFAVSAGGTITFKRSRKDIYVGVVNTNPAPPLELPVNGEYPVDVVGVATFTGLTTYPPSNMFTLLFGTLGAALKFCRDMRTIIEQLETSDSASGREQPDDYSNVDTKSGCPHSAYTVRNSHIANLYYLLFRSFMSFSAY